MVKPTIRDIELAVCLNFRLVLDQIRGPNRARGLARPRQIAMALTRELTGMSLPQIGRHFGNRDHTTVMHACRRIRELSASNPYVSEHVRDCRIMLKAVTSHRAMRTPAHDQLVWVL